MPLQGPGPLTLFVPTNKAVDRSRDGSIIYMLQEVSIQSEYVLFVFASILFFSLLNTLYISLPKAKHKLQELLRHHMFSKAAVRLLIFPIIRLSQTVCIYSLHTECFLCHFYML